MKDVSINICLLGFGAVGKEFYRQIKKVPEFGSLIGIHVVHVSDVSKHSVEVDTKDGGWILGDGYGVHVSDDTEWLNKSEGFNVVVDTMSYNEDSTKLAIDLVSKGLLFITCNKDLASLSWEKLVAASKMSDSRINFNAIPSSSSPTAYESVDLNESTWSNWVEDPEMFVFRGGGSTETARYLVDEVVRELRSREAE